MTIKAVDMGEGLMIEVIDVQEQEVESTGGARVEGLEDQLKKVVDGIRLAFDRIPQSLQNVAAEKVPDEFEVEFGISVTGRMRAIFVGAEGATTFKVKAVWKKLS